jgi:hypothetical protein
MEKTMSTKRILMTIVLIFVALTGISIYAAEEAPGSATPAKLRVGTYDSRSVALAFGRSKLGAAAIGKLMAEAKQAEKAGDQKQLGDLKKQGSNVQNLRHMQVFGNAPISDVLTQLQPALQDQAHAENLDLIVRDVDIAFQGANVELVDITKGLIDYCEPTKETLKVIEEMKGHTPIPLEQFPLQEGH